MAIKNGNRRPTKTEVTLGGFLATQFNDIGDSLGLDEDGRLRISDHDLNDFARLIEPKGRAVFRSLFRALAREDG